MRWTCPQCSITMPVEASDYPIRCSCGLVDDGKSPPILSRIGRFSLAAISHVASGLPTCSQDEVNARLDVCRKCAFFTGEICRKCGCPVKGGKFMNKLGWADQSCPVDKWGPVDVLIPLPHRDGPSHSLLGELVVAELAKMGMTGRVVVAKDRSAETLRGLVLANRCQVAMNHAMYFTPDAVEQVAQGFPKTNFVTVNHSSQSHLLHSQSWIGDQRKHWDLARTHDNIWLGLVDERLPVERHDRVVHVPNLVPDLKPDRLPLDGDPVISLCCRLDWAKNLPNQLAALAGLDAHVQICVKGLSAEDADAMADVYGIRSHSIVPWLTSWPRHVERLRSAHIGMQASFTESWNCAALEMMSLGRPVVGSTAVRYLPHSWRANPDDPRDIRCRLEMILAQYDDCCDSAAEVASDVRGRQSRLFREFIQRVAA